MPLFDEEEIHEDLHLMVTESPDESQIVVYGEMYVTFTVIFTGVIIESISRVIKHQCTFVARLVLTCC